MTISRNHGITFRWRIAASMLLFAWLAAPMIAVTAAEVPRPNIVLVMADDLGWGDLAYMGHPTVKTPHLDAMAAAGIRFDHFYAAAPVCSPTRGSVLTGRTPNRFGCFSWGHSLRPQEITLAERLRDAGYATGHFGKWHLGSVQKTSPVNPGASGFDHWLSAYNFYDNDPILSREGEAVPMKGESSMIAADAAIAFMQEQVEHQKPFLAVVWYGSPHAPHKAADEDAALYASEGKKADFLGEITGLDRATGKIRAALRSLGIEQNTLLWFCSDNGGLPGLGRTGGRAAKGSIYEGGLRVPALIEWPARFPKPRTVNIPASTVDIFPTVLAAVGLEPDGRPLDGIDLSPYIDDTTRPRDRPLGFWAHPTRGISMPSDAWMKDLLAAQKTGDAVGNVERLRLSAGKIDKQYPETQFPGHAAWLSWPWKLHRIEKPNASVTWELYNLESDPQEAHNVIGAEGQRAADLQKELEAWLASVARSLNGKDYP